MVDKQPEIEIISRGKKRKTSALMTNHLINIRN
jgi:hypothetical protein